MKTQKHKSEWKEVELKELGEIVTGNTPPKNNSQNYGGNHPWIKPPNLDKERYVSESEEYLSDFGKENSRILSPGSVLVSCIGNIGKIGISGCSLSTNQQINSIIPIENVSSEFLYYDIKKHQKRFENSSTNAVVPLLNKTEFSKIKIPFPFTIEGKPDLTTQKQIVAILEKSEKLKQKQKKVLEHYDEYLKSVFYEMFLKKGFEKVELEKVTEVIMGQSPAGSSYNKNKNGMPFFQGKSEFGERYPKVKYWTTEPSKIAESDSVLMSVRAPVGSVNVCNIKCCIGRGLASIKPKEEINLEYLFSLLQILENKIADLGSGSTFKAINSGPLRNLKIPLPPLPLQQKFANIVEKVEKLKEKQKKSLVDAKELFNVLMQKAFKGELN